MKHNFLQKEKSTTVTAIVTTVIIALFLVTYLQIANIQKRLCLRRMEEGVNLVIEEVTAKFSRESQILNATANIISNSENFSQETLQEALGTVSPLISTMKLYALLPDNTIVQPDGTVVDVSDTISFQKEVAHGEPVRILLPTSTRYSRTISFSRKPKA